MKRELYDDELYVVHLIEDTVPTANTMQLCRDWSTAMQVVNGYMADVCSEVWDEHVVEEPNSTRWLRAKWTWGFNEIRITVENVL